jgi:uncharacterized membrane protein YccC
MPGLFLLALFIVAGFWLVWVLVPKMDRRRNSRRIQREIAEYLRKIGAGKE